MARIKILVPVAGLDFSWVPGQEIDLEDVEAAKWADGVRAELVRKGSPAGRRERAIEPPTETRG